MLKGPSYYNPRLHPDRALRRRNTVINQMVKYDFLTEAEGEKHKACELGLRYTPTTHYSGPAPYLRERIRQDALRIIEAYNAEYGTDYNLLHRRYAPHHHPRRRNAAIRRRSR